jgi:excisionase family DNA binding protein
MVFNTVVEPETVPLFAHIDRWTEMTGVSRSTTYELIGSGELRARKLGARVLIDVAHGLQFLNSLPVADINMGKRRRKAA